VTRNPERRAALLDAAIEVLAGDGARGLTFRAVDQRAGTPVGTASNYFASREDLLMGVCGRITTRVLPEAGDTVVRERTTGQVVEFVRGIVRRVSADRAGYLAMLELRLEATRRPELMADLTAALRAQFEANVDFHVDAGLPGGRDGVIVLQLAVTGLLLEHLTLPDVLADHDLDALITTIVGRVT
jgi:DNA-binding transcriptional regulator YbjK